MYRTSKKISTFILLSMMLNILSPFIGMGVAYLKADETRLTEKYKVDSSELNLRYTIKDNGTFNKLDPIVSASTDVTYYITKGNTGISGIGSAIISDKMNSPLLLFEELDNKNNANKKLYSDFIVKDYKSNYIKDFTPGNGKLLFTHKSDTRSPKEISDLFKGIDVFSKSDTDYDKQFNAQLRNYFTSGLSNGNVYNLKGELGIDYKYGIKYYDVSVEYPTTINDISNKSKNSLLSNEIKFDTAYSGLIKGDNGNSLWFSKNEKILYTWGIIPNESLVDDKDDIDTIIFISTYSDDNTTIGKFRYYILHYNGLAKDNNKAKFFYQRFYSDSFMLSGIFEGSLIKGINDNYIRNVEDLTKTELIKAAWEIKEGKVNRYNPIIKYNFPIINLSFSIKGDGGTVVDSKLTVENTLNGLDDFMYYKKYGDSESATHSGGMEAAFKYTDDVGLYTIGYIEDTDAMRDFGLFASGLSSKDDAEGVSVGLAEEVYQRVVSMAGESRVSLSDIKDSKDSSTITYKALIETIEKEQKKKPGKDTFKLKSYEKAILEAWFNANVENIKKQLENISKLEKSKRAIAEGDVLRLSRDPIKMLSELIKVNLDAIIDGKPGYMNYTILPHLDDRYNIEAEIKGKGITPMTLYEKNDKRISTTVNPIKNLGWENISTASGSSITYKKKYPIISISDSKKDTNSIAQVCLLSKGYLKELSSELNKDTKKNENLLGYLNPYSDNNIADIKDKVVRLSLDEFIQVLLKDKSRRQELITLSAEYRYMIDQIIIAKEMTELPGMIIESLYNLPISKYIELNSNNPSTRPLDEFAQYPDLSHMIKYGNDVNPSTLYEFAREEVTGLKLPPYQWSKLWLMQYAYEIQLYNLNAMTFGYYQQINGNESLEETSVKSNQIKAPTFYNEINTDFGYIYSSNVLVKDNPDLYNAALTGVSYYTPKMKAFPEESLVTLMRRGTHGNNRIYSVENTPYYNFMKIMHEIASAFQIAYKSDNEFDEKGYSPKKLEENLKKWEDSKVDPNKQTFDGNEVSIGMVKSVLSLDKLCKFLKIDVGQWTPFIDEYRKDSIIEACKKYEENFLVKNAKLSQQSVKNPLGMFFDVSKETLSKDWAMGFGLSALYTPIQSNVNNAYTTDLLNKDNWIKDFYYKYGFYRKALYIDTSNSSVVDRYLTGKIGSRRVATLNDLINYNRDISLYVDDNYYNMDEASKIIDKLSTEENLDEPKKGNDEINGAPNASNSGTQENGSNGEQETNGEGTNSTEGTTQEPDNGVATPPAVTTEPDPNSTTTPPAVTTDPSQNSNGTSEPTQNSNENSGTSPQAFLDFLKPIKVKAASKQIIENMMGLLPEVFLKTDDNRYYKDDITNNIERLDGAKNNASGKHLFERFILKPLDIIRIIGEPEYSVRQSYAVVSTIYRSPSLFNEIQKAIANEEPVFTSSKNIIDVPGTTPKEYVSYMNYVMLSNLESEISNDIKIELDRSSPIFLDIFGNIISQSGTVIIPAASNGTILGENWTPTSIGFGTFYNGPNKIPFDVGTEDFKEWLTGNIESFSDVPNVSGTGKMRIKTVEPSDKYKDHEFGSGWFVKGEKSYLLKNTTITGFDNTATIMWRTLSKNSDSIRDVLYKNMVYNIVPKLYSANRVNMIVEVLRGAPIENINLRKEGIEGNTDISALDMKIAYGYEKLMELTSPVVSNAIVSMPNIAFVSGIEYIIVYLYKIMFAMFILIFIFMIYINAIKKQLSFMLFVKFIGMVLITTSCITIIPDIISYSYYTASRDLLKKEVSYVTMLNYNRQFNGSELGVTEIASPKSTTKLYLKLDNMRVDWSKIATKVLFNYTAKTLNELYKEEFDKNLVSKQKGVVHKGDRLYLDINDVLNSVKVIYNPKTKLLDIKNYSEDGHVLSYVSPYYVILNELVQSINTYNVKNEVTSYNVNTSEAGAISTNDTITAFLSSPEFLSEDYDITGLHKIYHTPSGKLALNGYEYYSGTESSGEGDVDPISVPSDLDRMKKSLWYSAKDDDTNYEYVEKIATYAREYVADNIELVGKIPDEAFLKVMALNIAMKHNDLFNVDAARAIEIQNMDSNDVLRFMLGDKSDVFRTFNFTLPRAAFELGGGHSVVVAVLITLLLYLTTFMKPLLVMLIVLMLLVNIIVNSLFRRDAGRSKVIEGFMITTGLIIVTNYLYALGVSSSVKVAQLNLGSMTSLLAALLVQLIYVAILFFIFLFTIRDYREIGMSTYRQVVDMLASAIPNVSMRAPRFGSSRARGGFSSSIMNSTGKDSRRKDIEDEEDMEERDRRRAEEARRNRI